MAWALGAMASQSVIRSEIIMFDQGGGNAGWHIEARLLSVGGIPFCY